MSRRSLGVIAILIILLMAVVATAGLDNLPREVRRSVDSAATQLATDRGAFDKHRAFVEQAVAGEPDLFQSKSAAWLARLDQGRARFDVAAATLAGLQKLAKDNKRADADRARRELAAFEAARQQPVRDAAELRAEAERWINYKKELPQRVQSMRVTYAELKNLDIDAAAAPARKAMTDWPAKNTDLEARVQSLQKLRTDGEQAWESSAGQVKAEESGNLKQFDYAAFFENGDRLEAVTRQVKEGVAALNALAGQLYVSWDKLVLDLDDDNGYREKLRIVRTRYPDATMTAGEVTNEEKWQTLDAAKFKEAQRTVGMVVERKPAGKYDSEAERAVQPPAYAYMAAPGQANAYGSWSGGVWHWLPQYLLLSTLLNANRGPMIAGDYHAYQQARTRGEVFYGRNNEYRPTWQSRNQGGGFGGAIRRSIDRARGNSSSGGWYKERPKSGGGYSGSGYQSRGSYSGSRYQSRGGFRSFSRGGGFRGGRR